MGKKPKVFTATFDEKGLAHCDKCGGTLTWGSPLTCRKCGANIAKVILYSKEGRQ